MPAKGMSTRLEEQEKEEWLIRHSDFRGGVGCKHLKEGVPDQQDLLGYWFGYNDTWVPGQMTPPLLTTTVEVNNEGSLTDYGSLACGVVAGMPRVFMVKGENAYIATGTTMSAAHNVDKAQGRQVLVAQVAATTVAVDMAVWFAGPGAPAQFCVDGAEWYPIYDDNAAAASNYRALFGFPIQDSTTHSSEICGVLVHTHRVHYLTVDGGAPWWSVTETTSPTFPERGPMPIFIGNLSGLYEAYIATGNEVWKIELAGGTMARTIYHPGLSHIEAGCVHGDEFVLTDGSTIMLWHPSRPPRYIPIWREDGAPPDLAGKVVGLMSVDDSVVAVWQTDLVTPATTGYCQLYWSRYNIQGQMTWHPRTKKLTGDLFRGCGGAIVLLQPTVTAQPATEYSSSFSDTVADVDDTLISFADTAGDNVTTAAQGFKVPYTGSLIWAEACLSKDNSATWDLVADIRTNNGGVPATGSPVATSEAIPAATLTAAGTWCAFWFATPPTLTANTVYHLCIRRSDNGESATPYYWFADKTGKQYSLGAASRYNSTDVSWDVVAADRCFRIYTTPCAYSSTRHIWLATVDGTDAWTHYQTHPYPSWNPLSDATLTYEDGPLYTYTSWEELQLFGDQAGALVEMERNAEFPEAASSIAVAYRFDYDSALTEEDGVADWKTELSFLTTRRRVEIGAGKGRQGTAVQFRIGPDRDSATKPPVLRDFGTTVKRQIRHPAIRRT